MSNVFSNFDTREISRRRYMMLDVFTYEDEVFGPIEVSKGFETDYASINVLIHLGLVIFYLLLIGYGDKAATVHDFFYAGNGIKRPDGTVYYPTREEADRIFYRALRAEAVAKWRAQLFYQGVRIGGASRFKGENKS